MRVEGEMNRPLVMGILNVTPDSFSDGGTHNTVESAVEFAKQMIADGADIIDIGGESTRPASKPVSEGEEFDRVIPVIRALKNAGNEIPLSVDTRRSSVARGALELGAEIINDVSALESSPDMAKVISAYNAKCVLMHGYSCAGNITMPNRVNVSPSQVINYLRDRIHYAESFGIKRGNIFIDPGIGFNKSTEDNLEILRHLDDFAELGVPMLMGLSRKRFIGELTNEPIPEKRLAGSLAGAIWSVLHGASVVRVHDVRETCQALNIIRELSYTNSVSIVSST